MIPSFIWLALCLTALLSTIQAVESPPPGFKVAFLGDQGLGSTSAQTLKLVKDEGTNLLVHLGDFDYLSNPAAWENQTDSVLGIDFPQIAVVGNHDLHAWQGSNGYASYIHSRLMRMGVTIHGESGVQCSFHYKGLFFVLTAPGLMGTGHGDFIRRELAKDSSIWKISAWHMNQTLMQVGSKLNETGWEVYEESRKGGAIIATAHEHSYSRTHLLSRMNEPQVVSRDSILHVGKGRTFAFVSGLGGGKIRPQLRSGNWWAKIYTSTQGAVPGALFGVFNVDGNTRKAFFYFKSINGKVVDRFEVYSDTTENTRSWITFPPNQPRLLKIDPKAMGLPLGGKLRLEDINGRSVAYIDNLQGPVTVQLQRTGLLFMRTGTDKLTLFQTIMVLP